MNTWYIFKREAKAFFASPMPYIVMTFYLIPCGFIFYFTVSGFQQQSLQAMQRQYGPQPNIMEGVLGPLMGTMAFLMLLLVPMVTMRLFAEEKRAGTLEMLLTFPVREIDVVLGKFFAAMSVIVIMLGFTATYPIFLGSITTIEIPPVLAGYLGLLLVAMVFVSIGMLISSLAENQIVAGFVTFGVLLVFWMIGGVGYFNQTPILGTVLTHLSLTEHLRNFLQGVIEVKSVAHYGILSFFALFLNYLVLQSYRWRG